jgi:uncharacterized protein
MTLPLPDAAHRPWPLPEGPWVMRQTWLDLLFAHWPVEVAALRPLIPARFALDLFEGQAWLGIVPFRMSGVRLRGTPALPWLSSFPELNVRTYVVAGAKPGVWFFSLDAGNPLAVAIARTWFHLPYFRARMKCAEREGYLHYLSGRTHRGTPSAVLEGFYRPTGDVFESRPGTLEYFLTERYCLYAADSRGTLYRGEIHHRKWPLQLAQAQFSRNTMAEATGIPLPPQKPLLHFSKRLEVAVWPPTRLDD